MDKDSNSLEIITMETLPVLLWPMLMRTTASSCSDRRNASLVDWSPGSEFEICGAPWQRCASSMALTQMPTSIVLSRPGRIASKSCNRYG